MPSLSEGQNTISIGDVTLDVIVRGDGPPMLYLHGAGGIRTDTPFLDLLARDARVIAPSHPGFGRSPLPDWFDTVDDLAYLYLDFLEAFDLHDVTLVGFSMGGWTAAEIAVRNTSRIARLILVDAVGIKVGDRETRDFPDMYAVNPVDLMNLLFHDTSFAPKIGEMSDDDITTVARNREAAAMYLWEPYLHNPKLRRRLHRIDVPTLMIWGAEDRLAPPAYGRAYCDSIPGATFTTIENCGHVPEVECPQELCDRIASFVRSTTGAAR